MVDHTSEFIQQAYSVSDLNAYIRALLESNENLMDIWVAGEVSNLSKPRSGHIYFTLKDMDASVRCVIWRVHANRLAGVFSDGMRVEVHGYISVYEGGGQYQLYVDGIRTVGEGRLYQEFLLLKDKLAAEGIFEDNRKRPIPPQPKLIGIVTSPTAAALQDMLKSLLNRFPMVEVVLSPASVQGEAAPAEIVKALERLNKLVNPDVILIGRGGGSLEDLWAFNDEQVVRAVAASEAPVISGVGHETDFTLTDFAADLRAPTPTGAAVMAVPDIDEINILLNGWNLLLKQTMEIVLEQQKHKLIERKNGLDLLSPGWQIKQRMQRLDNSSLRMEFLVNRYFLQQRQQLELSEEKIISYNPRHVLGRGYALVEDKDGNVIVTIKRVQLDQDITVHIFDGTISADVTAVKEKE